MINCPVCNTPNHHLAGTCVSCGSYLQRKVDNLDLFETSWSVIESPGKAFHNIAIALHKNFIFFISALAGIWESFHVFRLIEAGESTGLLNILAAGVVVGPFLGMCSTILLSLLILLVARMMGERTKFLNVFAVAAYSQIPLLLLTIFVLPLEIMTWGLYFFTKSPSAEQLYPTSYMIVTALTGICLMWSIALLFVGLRKLLDLNPVKTVIIGACSLGLLVFLETIGVQMVKQL